MSRSYYPAIFNTFSILMTRTMITTIMMVFTVQVVLPLSLHLFDSRLISVIIPRGSSTAFSSFIFSFEWYRYVIGGDDDLSPSLGLRRIRNWPPSTHSRMNNDAQVIHVSANPKTKNKFSVKGSVRRRPLGQIFFTAI